MAGVQGNRDSGVSDRGAPIKIGGRASTSAPADVADGARVNAYFDAKGRQVVLIDSASSVDTELPTAAALADDTANPTAPAVAAHGLVWDGAGWDRAPGNTQGAFVQGNVAAGSADSGNPAKIGGVYNATRPTYATGQRGDAQIDTRGSLRVILAQPDSGANFGGLTPADAQANNATGLVVLARPQLYNGATWDMWRGDTTGADTHLVPKTSGGLSTFHLMSAASTNATVVKASAGQLFGYYLYNSNAAARKVAFHNSATTPTAGASVFFSITVPPGGGANVEFANGVAFSAGIGITTVTGLADTDATAVGLNDLQINLFYK